MFVFFWDLGLFLATDATCDQMLNATCTADIDPINEIHSWWTPILAPWSNTRMSREIPSKLLVPRPLRFDEVNDSINKSGSLSQPALGKI